MAGENMLPLATSSSQLTVIVPMGKPGLFVHWTVAEYNVWENTGGRSAGVMAIVDGVVGQIPTLIIICAVAFVDGKRLSKTKY